ncbi:MAG: T9SS type A sorting domain-containing protein [Fluviicola sp.]
MNKYFFIVFLSIITNNSFGATYTTLASGDWQNTTNVWSLDGITPCGCSPGNNPNGDTVIVNHSLTSGQNLEFSNGAFLSVTANGGIDSNGSLVFTNSDGSINGNVTTNKFIVNPTATVDLNNAILTTNSQVDIFGTVNIDGGYTLMNGGNVEVHPGGTLNLDNAGKLDVQGGNITNSGTIDLCGTCCITTNGNWRNNSGGQVVGSGAARSENGNMRNFGNWAITVSWCSAGNAQGMPGFENCLSANATCNLVVLPVEFGEISAEVNADNLVQIDWNTVSERDNNYFVVLRYDENKEWIEVARVKGSGSTDKAQYYSTLDPKAPSGVNYYKVRQVDFNGAYSDSDPVTVTLESSKLHFYPNPASGAEILTISGLEEGTEVYIMSPSGMILTQVEAQEASIEYDLNELNLSAGIYLISAIHRGNKQAHKLVVH